MTEPTDNARAFVFTSYSSDRPVGETESASIAAANKLDLAAAPSIAAVCSLRELIIEDLPTPAEPSLHMRKARYLIRTHSEAEQRLASWSA